MVLPLFAGYKEHCGNDHRQDELFILAIIREQSLFVLQASF